MSLFIATGVLGVLFYLTAFWLLQTGRLAAGDRAYQMLNILGALCSLSSLLAEWSLTTLLGSASWLAIALWGFSKSRRAIV